MDTTQQLMGLRWTFRSSIPLGHIECRPFGEQRPKGLSTDIQGMVASESGWCPVGLCVDATKNMTQLHCMHRTGTYTYMEPFKCHPLLCQCKKKTIHAIHDEYMDSRIDCTDPKSINDH